MRILKAVTSLTLPAEDLTRFRKIIERQGLKQTDVFADFVRKYNAKWGDEAQVPEVKEYEFAKVPVSMKTCGKCGSEYNEVVHKECLGCRDGFGKEEVKNV